MASITRRPDGSYRARYRGPDRREKAKHFAKKSDAERWLATQMADIARGDWVDPALGRITLGEWISQWQKTLYHLRPTTVALNDGVIRNYLLPRFGSYALGQITPAAINAMIADDIKSGLSISAVRRHVIVLRTALGAAVSEGRLARNACDAVKLPAQPRRDKRFLNPGQVAALVEASPGHYRPLILTAAYVGLRWGELAGLPVENVDVLRRRIRVTQQLIDINGRVSVAEPKTKAGRRTVSMPATVAQVLGQQMAEPAVTTSGYMFPTVTGKPMKRANFRTVWRRTLQSVAHQRPESERAMWEALRFHELRHTAAALAIAQGAHPLTIRDRLGHASITVTLDVYGGLFPSTDEDLASSLDDVLQRAAQNQNADEVRTETATLAQIRRS